MAGIMLNIGTITATTKKPGLGRAGGTSTAKYHA